MGCKDRELEEVSSSRWVFRVTPSEREAWRRAAAERGVSVAEMMRSALNRYVGLEMRKRRAPVQIKRKAAAVMSSSHCAFSGLPRSECLCPLCSKEES